jgi:hypothetical protein
VADKVIVSNRGVLQAKYGNAFDKVKTAIDKLIAADKARGIDAQVVYLDDSAAMTQLGGTAVTNATDPRQNKDAIDKVYSGLDAPDYVMILGAPDVVPHQDLRNPAYDGINDADEFAWGDVPYASEKPYSQKPEDFVTVTRVVGRLPDVHSANDPELLLAALETAAKYSSKDRDEYLPYLGVSADVWKESTKLSLGNIFNDGGADMRLSPPSGPAWLASQKRLSHFFNCHGDNNNPEWAGQKGSSYPTAHQASRVIGKVTEGTICAAECCYGGQLYNPALAAGQMGICNAYMGSAAYAVMASSTIAYGPAKGNGAADLICQFFFRHVLSGSSLGRAMLEARQEFIAAMSVIDPIDLKTLAQFSLMGDPSIQPVAAPAPHGLMAPKTKGLIKSAGAALVAAMGSPVEARRLRLATFGAALGAIARVVIGGSPAMAASALIDTILQAVPALKVADSTIKSFSVRSPTPAMGFKSSAKLASVTPDVVHLVLSKEKSSKPHFAKVTAVVAMEVQGKISMVRVLHSR